MPRQPVDLQREALDLYATNVGGFYDPHDRTLYLLADQPAVMKQLAIAHELAHAIQDEQLGLERLTREAMRSEDAQPALSAALEGNAQAVAAEVVGADSADEDEMAGALIAESTALSASLAAQSSGVNPWLALQLSFSYEAGAELHRRGAAEVVALSAVHAMGESRSASEGGPDMFATRPGQLPVFAMKSPMALPGLEPQSARADEDPLAHAAPEPCKNSGTCEEPSIAPAAHCAGLPDVHCSNVARALQALLELAKQAGIDPDHPAMKAAAAELEELATYIAPQPGEER